jgi:hypothetical protein
LVGIVYCAAADMLISACSSQSSDYEPVNYYKTIFYCIIETTLLSYTHI